MEQLELTIKVTQRYEAFPDGDTHGEIQDIPQDRIALGAWQVRKGGSLPFPDEGEGNETKQWQIESRGVGHGENEGTQGYHLQSLASCTSVLAVHAWLIDAADRNVRYLVKHHS